MRRSRRAGPADNGRLATDGRYETTLTVGDGTLAASAPVRLSASVHASAAAAQPWVPTDAQKASLEGLMSFDPGPCEGGCLSSGP